MNYPAHPLTGEECIRLLDACGETWVGKRNRALVTVGFRAGLRCNEALSLELDDVRRVPGGLVLRVREPKGYKRGVRPREVGLDPKATDIVEDWTTVRDAADGPLFCSRSRVRLLTSYVRAVMPRLARDAALHRRVHFHALRHTFARQLYDEGVGLMEIMLALGHTSLATTQKYLRSIGATEVIDVTTRREW